MSTYQSDRPAVPVNIRREVEVEAGHKCSITTCHEHTYLEIHHINQDRADNRRENLILLCDKHHKMAHARVIDTKALLSYKELLRSHSSGRNFVRGQEGDRVREFLETVSNLLSYTDCGEIAWAGTETGYWFEQEIYLKLIDFFNNIDSYNQKLRSYDQSARNSQDRIVNLLQRLLDIREQGDYRYNGGHSARFTPRNPPGTSGYDREIDKQREIVADILWEIQKMVHELWHYVENRPA